MTQKCFINFEFSSGTLFSIWKCIKLWRKKYIFYKWNRRRQSQKQNWKEMNKKEHPPENFLRRQLTSCKNFAQCSLCTHTYIYITHTQTQIHTHTHVLERSVRITHLKSKTFFSGGFFYTKKKPSHSIQVEKASLYHFLCSQMSSFSVSHPPLPKMKKKI